MIDNDRYNDDTPLETVEQIMGSLEVVLTQYKGEDDENRN